MSEATAPTPKLDKRRLFHSLGYRPHAGQIEVHKSTASRRILVTGVRWGKTLCAAMEGLAAAMQPCDRSIGWTVAPTYDLADRVFREIQYIASRYIPHHIITMKDAERRLILRNMAGGVSEIRGKSADNPMSLLGEGLDWVVIDEAARLKPAIWQSHLSQRLIDKNGWALLISTPRGKGYFFDLFRRGQGQDQDYQSWIYPSWTNPHLDATLIEAERHRLPERVFRQEFGAEFLEGSGQVFRFIREAATGELEEPDPRMRYVIGLDLAKVEDYSVIVVLDREKKVVHVDRFNRIDWGLQIERIRATSERYNRAVVYCDTTGQGEPIYEALCKTGMYVEPYTFTSKSKAALVDNLAMMLEKRELTLPRADLCAELVDELESFEYSVTDNGNVRTGAPGGYHDDTVVALALGCWGVRAIQPMGVRFGVSYRARPPGLGNFGIFPPGW